MFRSLHNPLFKEWSSARGLKCIPGSSRSYTKCRSNVTVKVTGVRLDYFLVGPAGGRRYSTLPKSHIEGQKNKNAPIPPGPNPANKPKIELRPAPKKVSKEELVSSNPPPPPTLPFEHVNSSASSSTQADLVIPVPDPSLADMGPVESTKYDLVQSRKQGIMTAPPEGASKLKTLTHNLKQFFWFYYGGLKKIFTTNRREVQAIRRRMKDCQKRGDFPFITRQEILFIRTWQQDIIRLFPFVVTLVLLEEVIPIIILYTPVLLPSTCLLPSQQERIRAKRRTKQIIHLALAKSELKDPAAITSLVSNGSRGLSSSLTATVSGIFGHVTFLPAFIQRIRLERYLARLSRDDALLVKEDMGGQLTAAELVEALEARGIVSERPLTYSQHLEKLDWWLKGARDTNSRLGLVLHYALDLPAQR